MKYLQKKRFAIMRNHQLKKNLIRLSDAKFSVGGVSVVSDSITQKITMKGTASSGGGRLNSLGEVTLEEGVYVFVTQPTMSVTTTALTKKDNSSIVRWATGATISISEAGIYIVGVNVAKGTTYGSTFGVRLFKV